MKSSTTRAKATVVKPDPLQEIMNLIEKYVDDPIKVTPWEIEQKIYDYASRRVQRALSQ
jgi:hypothetical protein